MACKVLPCPKCGQFNTNRRITCKKCGVNLSESQADKEKLSDSEQEVSSTIRSDSLEQNIVKYVNQGYHVVSRTENSAQLVLPKEFSFLWALLWFLVFGIGLIIYILYYLSKHDNVIYISVEPSGKVVVA